MAEGLLLKVLTLPCVDNVFANENAKEIMTKEGHGAVGGRRGIFVVFVAATMELLRYLGYAESAMIAEQPTMWIRDEIMMVKILEMVPIRNHMNMMYCCNRNRNTFVNFWGGPNTPAEAGLEWEQ
jgi:hypothetical protein